MSGARRRRVVPKRHVPWETGLDRAIRLLGGVDRTARVLHRKRQVIQIWRTRGYVPKTQDLIALAVAVGIAIPPALAELAGRPVETPGYPRRRA